MGSTSFKQWLKEPRWPPGLRYALAWHAASTFAGFVVAAVLLIIQPFELDRGLGDRGRDAFYKVASFAYPEGRSPKSIVVELDQRFLDAEHRTWPVSLGVHGDVLDAINSHQPRAIFIDFAFIDQRNDPELGYFLDTVRRIAETTPIYFAAAPSSMAPKVARPEIAALQSTPNITFVSVALPEEEPPASTYRIEDDHDHRTPAAVRLYQDLCATPGACVLPERRADMDIWWAVHRNRGPNRRAFNCRGDDLIHMCDHLPHGVVQRGLSMTALVLRGIVGPPIDPVPMAYTPVISVSDLLNGNSVRVWEPQMQGAVVFYGGSIGFVGDTVDNPVNGPTTGVQRHAMAFDNLVALEGAYVQSRPPFGWGFKGHTIVLCGLLALASLLVRAAITLRRANLRLQPHLREHIFAWFDAATFVIGALAIAVFEFGVIHVGPSAWAPVLVAALAGDFLSKRPMVRVLLVTALGRRGATQPKKEKKRPRWRR
jgi:CHASE2 domain-containing sensor protein